MDSKELKEKCIQLYIKEEKTYSDIAKEVGYSRTYITKLIEDDPRIIVARNTKKIKVYKREDNNQMRIDIPTEFIERIGISHNKEISEYVNITVNDSTGEITIKKHS